MDIAQFLKDFGFPVVMALLMFWLIASKMEKNTQALIEMKEAINKDTHSSIELKNSVQSNTIVLHELANEIKNLKEVYKGVI